MKRMGIKEGLDEGTKEEYQKFFNAAMKKFGIDSPADLKSDEEKKTHLLNAFSQIGKNYDFSFNVESTDELVCSELVYASFEDLVWDTKKQLGRYTISPDQVARKLITDKRFEPVLLYLNGNSVNGELKPVFNGLLDK